MLAAAGDAHAEAAVHGLCPLLREPERRLRHLVLEDLVDRASSEPELRAWAALFAARYLDLHDAQAAGDSDRGGGADMVATSTSSVGRSRWIAIISVTPSMMTSLHLSLPSSSIAPASRHGCSGRCGGSGGSCSIAACRRLPWGRLSAVRAG